MRIGRVLILLAVVVILGGAAIFLYFQFFAPPGDNGEEVVATPVIETVNVVISARDTIGRGQPITTDRLDFIVLPRESVRQGWFVVQLDDGGAPQYESVEGLLSKLARQDIVPDTILHANMLVDSAEQLSEGGSTASLLIPHGMVAISIPLTRFSSVSYGLERGDHINVIVSLPVVDLDANFQTILPNQTAAILAPGSLEGELSVLTAQIEGGGLISVQGRTEIDPNLTQPFYVQPSEYQRPRLVSQTLLQDVIVLHVGEFAPPGVTEAALLSPEATPDPAAETEDHEPGEEPTPVVLEIIRPDIITIIVTPQDAVTLNYLMLSGAQLNMVMRPSGDDTRVQTEAVTLAFLFDRYNIPVPAKLTYGLDPRLEWIYPTYYQTETLDTPLIVETPEE